MRNAEQIETNPSLERHERKCVVCSHPDRETIEEDFLCWHSAGRIGKRYDIEDDSVYRHAHALGLFEKRCTTARLALSRIIERALYLDHVTCDAVIRAVRVYCSIDESGHLIHRTAHVIHHADAAVPRSESPSGSPHLELAATHDHQPLATLPAGSPGEIISNRGLARLEIGATD